MPTGNKWVSPQGDEQSVNTGVNTGAGQYVDIAALAGGGAVAVWQEWDSINNTWESYAQILGADGLPVGARIFVSEGRSFSNANPQVTALAGGGFAVTFETLDGNFWGTAARQYDANGNRVGAARVNDYILNDQIESDIAGLARGGSVVVWTSFGQDNGGNAIYCQLLDAGGAQIGTEFRISTTGFGTEGGMPHVQALANGGFFVMWHIGDTAYGQRFNPSGTAIGSEIAMGSGGRQQFAVLADGSLAVVWTEDTPGTGSDVYLQVFGLNGAPLTAMTMVNTSAAGGQMSPYVHALADGGFLVTWEDGTAGGSGGHGLMARRFAATGDPVGGEFLVNAGDGTLSADGEPKLQVTQLADGTVMFSWVEHSIDPVTFALTNTIKSRLFDLAEIDIGSDGDDLIRTFARDNFLAGGAGDDTLAGGGGDDILFGNDGRDLLRGGSGDDALDGGEGFDTLIGGGGNDSLSGGGAGDIIKGGGGNDTADGGTGFDWIYLGAGHDLGSGGAGHDNLFGQNGRDTLLGDDGNDRLFGGAHNDKLNGGAGNDTLIGSTGDDVFIFTGGADVIADWDMETIRIDSAVWGGGARTPAEVFDFASQIGQHTVFDFGNGNSLTVRATSDWAALEAWIAVI